MKQVFKIVEHRILFETSDAEAHEYASTQAVPPQDIVDLVKQAQGAIDQEDLHADGFGPPPHVTVLYGIGDEDKNVAVDTMRNAGPMKAKVSGVDLFQNDDYDVVIFAVDSEDLQGLRQQLDQAIPDNMNSYPDYKPHMTIAYVMPGMGEKYKDMESELIGREFDLDALEFSGTQDGDVERVDLNPAVVAQELGESGSSPLFGTDILAAEDPDAEVMAALKPILNRSNRRAVSVNDDEVLLDSGQSLVVKKGDGDSWIVTHYDEQFDTSDLKGIEDLVKRLSEQAGDEPDWTPYDDAPPEPAADADAPPEKPRAKPVPRVPQSNVVDMLSHGYDISLTVAQPTGMRGDRRFDRVDLVLSPLAQHLRGIATARRKTANSISVDVHDKTPRMFQMVTKIIRETLGDKFEVRDVTKTPKPTMWQRVRGQVADDVSEDTFSSDVGFSDTIPVTKVRRRKVKLPGLTTSGGRRRVKRSYKVKESMSKGTSPILIVLRPRQVQALSAKPVWSALQESGVIDTKPFTMGNEEFFEVSIDTLRKEWSQANAEVLLDEVASIDPRIQRKIMECVDAKSVADYVVRKHCDWCAGIPMEVALQESESIVSEHRRLRLEGQMINEKTSTLILSGDVTIARKMFEWYGLSTEVLERLKSIDVVPFTPAAKSILEDDGTDQGANLGAMADPSGAALGAVNQGYGEASPEGVESGARNWAPQAMFKVHVLTGDTPQWVYRQVVGHEGEGEQSLIVYRTPEGRVMRMPHQQIDAAIGFGAVVTPDELTGAEPDEQPVPTFPQPDQAPAPDMMPVGEQADPNHDKLGRDAGFTRALTQYQQTRNEQDWDVVRREAERVTRLQGPDLDKTLAGYADNGEGDGQERKPMYGGTYEQEEFVAPEDPEPEADRVAEAIRRFSNDEKFHGLMNKFEATQNEGYLLRATERASRVAGIPVHEARELVEEIRKATTR